MSTHIQNVAVGSSTTTAPTRQFNRPRTHKPIPTDIIGGEKKTWEQLGLRKSLVEGLVRAYPEAVAPTPAQALFIPAILEGRDLLVKDDTGSGKSFGIALGLLGKPRVKYVVTGKAEERESVTALVLVPQSNLAIQYYQWLTRIAEGSILTDGVGIDTDRIVQRLIREGQEHLSMGLRKLHETKPHILISTPQAILDLYKKDPDLVPFQYLSTVVVDEVDYLIETVPRKDPEKSWKGSYDKAVKKIRMHPGPTRELLDLIYVARKEINSRAQEWAWKQGDEGPYRKGSFVGSSDMPGPQLVVASATLRTHLSNYLYEESGWLNKKFVMKVKNTGSKPAKKELEDEGVLDERVREAARSGRVKHCVIEVSETDVRNVEGAINVEDDVTTGMTEGGGEKLEAQKIFADLADDPQQQDHGREIQGGVNFADGDLMEKADEEWVTDEFVERYRNTPSPFNPNALEAMATAVALDVPRLALLVIPSSAPVFRAVYELREMGLDARVFDPQKPSVGKEEGEDPVLLVTTMAMARGLDLPETTHVFSLGIPEGPRVTGRSIDAYLHVSGRVGRFGRRGTVVTVVDKEATETVTAGERMKRILREIGVAPVRFRQFK